jgi:Sulfotransferase family
LRRGDVSTLGVANAYDPCVGRLPDFYVIGAPKCGTTSLHAALDRHPQLFMSAIKEPKYFLGDDQPPQPSDGPNDAAHLARYVWRRQDYEALFDDAPASSRCGESTPYYLGDPAALERLHSATPDARLIAVLRDPIDRAWSNWATNWPQRDPIHDLVKACEAEPRRLAAGWEPYWGYVTYGLYGRGLRRVFELFPKDHVLVLRFADLVNDAEVTLARIHRFLGVEAHSDDSGLPFVNASTVVPQDWLTRLEWWAYRRRLIVNRIPPRVRRRLVITDHRRTVNHGPPASVRRKLMPLFADDIRLTHELTGLDVDDWLHT